MSSRLLVLAGPTAVGKGTIVAELRRRFSVSAAEVGDQDLHRRALIGLDTRDALGSLLRGHLEELDPPPRVVTWVQTYQLARQLVVAVAVQLGNAVVVGVAVAPGLFRGIHGRIGMAAEHLDIVAVAREKGDANAG